MGRNHLCEQAIPEDPAHLLHRPCDPRKPSGLSLGFPRLSPSRRQLDYVLLARPPLYSPCGFRVRLACLIHAANVRSEPGSNPSLEVFIQLLVASPAARRSLGQVTGGFAVGRTHEECRQQPRSHASFEATQDVKDLLGGARRRRSRAVRGAGDSSERHGRLQARLAIFFAGATSDWREAAYGGLFAWRCYWQRSMRMARAGLRARMRSNSPPAGSRRSTASISEPSVRWDRIDMRAPCTSTPHQW